MTDRTSDILTSRWTALPNNEIGGWAVSTIGRSPADGGVMAADMVWSQQVAEHVADVHNRHLPDGDPDYTLAIESAGPSARSGFEFRMRPGIDLAKHLTQSVRTVLDGHGAENYVEMRFDDGEGNEYVATFRRRNGKTPDELRREAEAERDTAREVARSNKRHNAVLAEMLDRVEKFADRLAGYCSPFGVATRYADELRRELARPTKAEKGSADAVSARRHCTTCACIHERCGYAISSPGCISECGQP